MGLAEKLNREQLNRQFECGCSRLGLGYCPQHWSLLSPQEKRAHLRRVESERGAGVEPPALREQQSGQAARSSADDH